MIAFPVMHRRADNAPMHSRDYSTAAARALLDLCLKKNRGRYILAKEDSDGRMRVNANALARAMSEADITLPQPTITRLLNGVHSKASTFQAIAAFFGVSMAVARGEEPLRESPAVDTPIVIAPNEWPFSFSYAEWDRLDPERKKDFDAHARLELRRLLREQRMVMDNV